MGRIIWPEEFQKRNMNWNKGYSDGYQGFPAQIGMPDPYYTGFEVGKDDREEDDEALATGDCDMLTDEESREIYGDPKDSA